MNTLDVAVLAVSTPTLVAYVCRLNLLQFNANTPLIVVMHAAFAIAVAFCGYAAWQGQSDGADVATVIGAACWIAISYGSWRHGVPEHFTKPGHLDEIDSSRWDEVIGRGKE